MCCGSCGAAASAAAWLRRNGVGASWRGQPRLPERRTGQPSRPPARRVLPPPAGAFGTTGFTGAGIGLLLLRSDGCLCFLRDTSAARRFHCGPAVFVLKTLHTINRFLFRARKQRRRLAKFRPRLQSAPRELPQKSVLRRVRQLAQSELLPHLGCRVRHNRIRQRRNHANCLCRRRQHPRLQLRVLRIRSLRRLLPGRIRRQVAVRLRHQEPQALQRFGEIQLVKRRPERRDRRLRVFAQRCFSPRSPRPPPAQLRRSTCAPCSPRGSQGCRSRWPGRRCTAAPARRN